MANPRSLKAEQTLVIYQNGGGPSGGPSQSETDDNTASVNTAPAQAVQTAAVVPSKNVKGNTTLHSGKRLVKQGETLYGIAQELGVPVNELATINGLNARRPQIFPGDVLVYTPRPGQPAASASETSASKTTVAAPTASKPQPSASTGQVVMYTVKTGDNLWRIALNFGVTVDSIRDSNNLTPSSVIMPGDVLKIVR